MFLIVSDCFFQTETVPPAALLHHDSLHHQHQLAPVDLTARRTGFRQREGAALQSFVIQHKPAVLPVQELHMCAPAVQEHEHLTTGRTPSKTTGNQAAKPVKTFAHVTMAAEQVITVRGTQAEHQTRAINWDNSPRSDEGTSSRTPLG